MLKTLANLALQHFTGWFYRSKFIAIAYWIIKLPTSKSFSISLISSNTPSTLNVQCKQHKIGINT